MIFPRSLLVVVATLASACWVEPDESPTAMPRGTPPSSGSPAQTTSPPIQPQPLLVKVDTGRTLNAAPGEGVGIFVEYASGGRWHVWWTCDTRKTEASCDFDLRVVSNSGDLESIQSEGVLASDSVVSTDTRTIEARSTTGDNAVGIRFEAPPRGIITLDAKVGGLRDSSYFFFVQDGKPNGGFTGTLTNPIQFQGTLP